MNAVRLSILAAASVLLLAGSARSAGAATLLVANKSEATVSLIDLGTGKVVVTLPVGKGPHEAAVSPSGKRALVANYGDREQPGSTLTVLDVPGGRVEKTVDLGEHRRPHGMVWLDERRALVTSETSHALLEVDVDAGDAGKVTAAIATDQEGSHMVAASPDGARAYVANIKSGSMTAIDLKTKKRLANVPAAAGTEGIAVTPDGKQVWVTNREVDSVSVIDAASLKVLATLASPSLPIRAKATPDGRRVLITNATSGDLSIFSVAGRKLERRVPLGLAGKVDHPNLPDLGDGSLPVGLVVAPDGKRAYIAHTNADRISILDLATWKQVGTLTAGKEPDGMAFSPVDVKPAPKAHAAVP